MKFLSADPIKNKPAFDQLITWCRADATSLSMVNWLTHICYTWRRWFNTGRWCPDRVERYCLYILISWWRHQMETFSALLSICTGNSQVSGEFLAQRPVTRSFDVFLDLRLNKRLNIQLSGWWFETLSRPLWRHSNVQQKKHVLLRLKFRSAAW